MSEFRSFIGNTWNENTQVQIMPDGLQISNNSKWKWQNAFAREAFPISVPMNCGKEQFTAGSIVHYFEQTKPIENWGWYYVGLSDGLIPDGTRVGHTQNSFSISNDEYSWICGNQHKFEWPNGAIKPEWNGPGEVDVVGCGLLLSPKNGLSIFFTGNGILMGKQIAINPSATCLYPTVSIWRNIQLVANFGGDPAKPFKFNVDRCPGLDFE